MTGTGSSGTGSGMGSTGTVTGTGTSGPVQPVPALVRLAQAPALARPVRWHGQRLGPAPVRVRAASPAGLSTPLPRSQHGHLASARPPRHRRRRLGRQAAVRRARRLARRQVRLAPVRRARGAGSPGLARRQRSTGAGTRCCDRFDSSQRHPQPLQARARPELTRAWLAPGPLALTRPRTT